MVAGVSKKKWRFSATEMVWRGCDFWWHCRASTILIICMGALAGWQVQANMVVSDGLAVKTGALFWRWMPLPSQDCTPGSALDQNNLHVHFRGHVDIYIRDTCMLMHHSLDNTIIAHADQHISSIAWAPDPGAPSSGGARSPRVAKTSRSTPITAQVVEDKKARAASTSVPSNSALGDEKGLTGGSKRGKQGGNKSMRSPVAALTSESSNLDVGNEKGPTGGGKRGKQVGKKAGAAGDVSGGRAP